jgi:peroxiredoxin
MTLQPGDALPDLELIDHRGQVWRPAKQRGRPLVLILHRHLG